MSTDLFTNMSVGGYISELSRDKGLSQSDVARECGLSRQILSYIISGERKMTIPQALRLESLFSLKSGTLLKMQEEETVRIYKEKLRHSLVEKLLKSNAFWSYDSVTEKDISDEDIIENTLIHLDMDDISRLFELYTRKFVRKVWEDRMAGQGDYLDSLNMMIAQYYFGISNPERFLRKKEISHIKKITAYA